MGDSVTIRGRSFLRSLLCTDRNFLNKNSVPFLTQPHGFLTGFAPEQEHAAIDPARSLLNENLEPDLGGWRRVGESRR